MITSQDRPPAEVRTASSNGWRHNRAWIVASCSVAFAAFAWAIAVSVSDGFVLTAAGVRLSSHRVVPAFLAGLVFLLLPSRSRAFALAVAGRVAGLSPHVVAAIASGIAVLTFAVAMAFGAFTAVGDAFGYIAESTLWLKGQLFQSPGPVLAMMWPDGGFALSPLGFRPGLVTGTMVPVYAPGLPLLMAMLRAGLGEIGAYLVVPLSGAATVYLTFRLGRIWRDGVTALFAAALVAASPVFLFQLVQPMSDVPVTAWWLLAIVAACDGSWKGAFGSGLAASVAVLIRPNLAPLAAPLAGWVFVFPDGGVRRRTARLLFFGAAVAPLCLLAAWAQTALYGSPVASGYGRAADIYGLRNLVPNLQRYPAWLIQTHSPFLLLALVAPFGGRRGGGNTQPRARFAWLALMFAACVFLCYAFYIPFDHWSYLRFLLPCLPLLILLSAGALMSLCRRWPGWRPLATACCTAMLLLVYVQGAVHGDVFELRSAFRSRFREVGRFVSERSPRNAALIGLVQTSSIAYYGHRQTVRYDLIPPAEFDRAVEHLRHAGYQPYLLLMAEEERDFRARFAGKSQVGELRCAPRSTFAGGAVRLYDVADCETGRGK